jgi:uncharacterized protein YkwD
MGPGAFAQESEPSALSPSAAGVIGTGPDAIPRAAEVDLDAGTDGTLQVYLPVIRQPLDQVDALAAAINRVRIAQGCSELRDNAQLTAAAQAHSADMAHNDYFALQSQDGTSPEERIHAAGYLFSQTTTLIAWNEADLLAQIRLTDCDLQEAGIGYVYLPDDGGNVRYGRYWTAALARPSGPMPGYATASQSMLDAVNAARGQAGCPALIANEKLTRAAQAHTQDMVDHDFFDHQGSDGSWPHERVLREGYVYAYVGETIARLKTDRPEDVLKLWLGSDGHERIILNCNAAEIGVGYYYEHWTLVLASAL